MTQLIIIDTRKRRKTSVWVSKDSDGKTWLDFDGVAHKEFMRGNFGIIPLVRSGKLQWLYGFDKTPSLMDIMRFAGFCYEDGVTFFDWRRPDRTSAKAPVNEYELFSRSKTHVIINMRGF